jgi:hypothetical protein
LAKKNWKIFKKYFSDGTEKLHTDLFWNKSVIEGDAQNFRLS